MSYGAFVKLEPGIEGLVHISEMSWTKRINHPSELVSIGDQIEVQVLNINKDKQEISLGIKQVQPNPWDKVAERYPPGMQISGVVRNLTNYGAFIEIEEGIDGLLHVSDMSWVRKVGHPSEVVQKGDKVKCVILNVDQERKRVALGLKQMNNDPWEGDIPGRYHPGDLKTGKVTKLTNFGVFVELEPGLEGLLHISELSDQKIESPEEVVKVGDEVEVKILRVDAADRKIGLSRKRLHEPEPAEGEEPPAEEGTATAPSRARTARRHWWGSRPADSRCRKRRKNRSRAPWASPCGPLTFRTNNLDFTLAHGIHPVSFFCSDHADYAAQSNYAEGSLHTAVCALPHSCPRKSHAIRLAAPASVEAPSCPVDTDTDCRHYPARPDLLLETPL